MLQTWQVERESTVYRGALAYHDIWFKKKKLFSFTYIQKEYVWRYLSYIYFDFHSIHLKPVLFHFIVELTAFDSLKLLART